MSVKFTLASPAPETTMALGKSIGEHVPKGSVLALAGQLAAGKTTLVQGLALGLKTDPAHPVTSPSYNLIHEYPGSVPLYHFDFYRLERIEEVMALGYEEYFEGDGVCVVEWAEKFPQVFPDSALWITITRQDDDTRLLEFKGQDSWASLEELVEKNLGKTRSIIR